MSIPETGYTDYHTHPASRCRILTECDAREARTWDEAKQIITKYVKANPERDRFVIHGWDQAIWGAPSTEELSTLTKKPVVIVNISYHAAITNEGLVSEQDFEKLAIETLPKKDDLLVAIPKYHKFLSSLGVVAAHDMHLATMDQIDAYRELDESMILAVDTTAFVNSRLLSHVRLPQLIASPGERFRLAGVKIFLDGAIGTHTAYVNEPYVDTHDHGILRHTKEECMTIIKQALSIGLETPAVHAIGDAAVTAVLDVYQTLADAGHDTHGWRIEHAEMIQPDDIPRIAALGITLVMSPNFHWDLEHYADRLGDALHLINPFRTLYDAGVNILFGSDGMPEGPKIGIDYALNRARFPEQKITLEEALRSYGIQ